MEMNQASLEHEPIVIVNGFLVTRDRIIEGDLLIANGKIERVGKIDHPYSKYKSLQKIDASDLYVAPGFIDLHVNGGGGYSFLDCTEESFQKIIDFHVSHGTTGLLPTAVAAPAQQVRDFLRLVRLFRDQRRGPLGAHLEGPFVSLKRRGALDSRFILPPSVEKFRELVSGYEDIVKVVTLAPEEPGAVEVIREVQRIGAIASLGHSDATYEDTFRALEVGLRHFTHFFNAMNGLHHRQPGAVGAALEFEGTTLELIADGVHVHPAVIRLLLRLKGVDAICLVTDAIAAAGVGDGKYLLGGLEVIVSGGQCRLPDGTFAGSTLTMDRAVKNLVEFGSVSLPEAVRAASYNPARLLGLDHCKGTLEVGKDADIVVFDSEFQVHYTLIAGEIVYNKEEVGNEKMA